MSFWEGKASACYLPQELDNRELQELAAYGRLPTAMLVYGRQVLMVSAQCILHNTTGCKAGGEQFIEMKDRKSALLYCYNQCTFCYNVLYGGKMLNLLDETDKIAKIALAEARMDFTTESRGEVKKILSMWEESWRDNTGAFDKKRYTTGHFYKKIQ